MEIDLENLKKNPEKLELKGVAEEMPELADTGCYGEIQVNFKVTAAVSNTWLDGKIAGQMKYECSGCGDKVNGKFVLPIKILIESRDEEGVFWEEEEIGDYNDYLVQYGPGTTVIPVDEQVREQIILNCDPWRPGEDGDLEPCPNCESGGKKLDSKPKKPEIDSRWEKLKDLL